jgi:hypothetical protein
MTVRSEKWFMLAMILAGCCFLYLQVFILPAVPVIAEGDQAIFLQNATRMLEGQTIYRDYDSLTLPGTDVVYFVFLKLFGDRTWIPQAALVLIGILLFWLTVVISRTLMTGRVAYLPGLLFLSLPFSGYLDAEHRWYSTLAATAALAIVMKERTTARLALAGALWGISTCFTQSSIAGVLAFGLFLWWEQQRHRETRRLLLKKETCLGGAFLATVASFNAYFVWKAGPKQVFSNTVIFVAKYYPADNFNNWRFYLRGLPNFLDLRNWLELPGIVIVHMLLPLIYILFLVRYSRHSKSDPDEPWDRLMLLSFCGLFLFLTVAAAPVYWRLCSVSGPALILFTWFLTRWGKVGQMSLRGLCALTIVLAIGKPLATQMRWKRYVDLPTGRTAFFRPASYEKYMWVSEHIKAPDYLFGDPLLCFAFKLRNPARIPFVRPNDYTRPEQVADVVQALETHRVRYVNWYHGLDVPADSKSDHLLLLRTYLHDHYHVAKTFQNLDEVWERTR